MPQPTASAIVLSERQKRLLEQITRANTNPYWLVQRVQLILWAASGMMNTEVGLSLRLTRGQVRLWRNRSKMEFRQSSKQNQKEKMGISSARR